MNQSLAEFIAYSALLIDGNSLTNHMSIGKKTTLTGKDPQGGGLIAGLNTHAVFEGDASITRGDAFFGDNHSFNQTLWDEADAVLTLEFFIDGRKKDLELDLDVALGFFRDMKFPQGFFRPPTPRGALYIQQIHDAHPVHPGVNQGAISTFTPDPVQTGLPTFCQVYSDFVHTTAQLYPNPKGALREALDRNLNFLYNTIRDDPTCSQIFPFGI